MPNMPGGARQSGPESGKAAQGAPGLAKNVLSRAAAVRDGATAAVRGRV